MSSINNEALIGKPYSKLMEYWDKKKKLAVAYAFWFFLGGFGAHRMYALTNDTDVDPLAIAMPACFIIGLALMYIFAGNPAMYVLGIISVFFTFCVNVCDLFLLPSIIRKSNLKIINSLGLDIKDVDIRI